MSQTYQMTFRDLEFSLDSPLPNVIVDEYTKKGLFKHLQSYDGRALITNEEMGAFFDLVQKRQIKGNAECQLYCRLYDEGQWINSTGNFH